MQWRACAPRDINREGYDFLISLNPFCLLCHRLEQIKALRKWMQPVYLTESHHQMHSVRYDIPGSHIYQKVKLHPAVKFPLSNAQQLCTDLLPRLFRYNELLTVFFLYTFIRLACRLSVLLVSIHDSLYERCCSVLCPFKTLALALR